MKQLLIIRHAKSGWNINTLSDFDRTLNERGHIDAPKMAQQLLAKNIQIDTFISSPAKRAVTTAAYFAKAYHKNEQDIVQVKELYLADVSTFYDVIKNINNSSNSVAIFSHNPGITHFVNGLTKTQIDEMPTCGIFSIQIESNSWENFKTAKKSFAFFYYPKGL